MCGRIAQTRKAEVYARMIGMELSAPEVEPIFDLTPGMCPIAFFNTDGTVHIDRPYWGFTPHWAGPDNKIKPINARFDTAAIKPFFREAFRRRRCLVPIDAFYEWKAGEGTHQRYCIRRRDGEPFMLAGLWDEWQGRRNLVLMTTDPNRTMRAVHDRMPVIVESDVYRKWMDPELVDAKEAYALIRPTGDSELEAFPVNNKGKGEELFLPI